LRHIACLIFIFFSSLSLAAPSGVIRAKPQPVSPVDSDPSGLTAGYEYGSYQYEEPGIMQYTGNLSGVDLGYEHAIGPQEMLFKLELEYLSGDLRYDGSLWTGEALTSLSRDAIWSLRSTMAMQIDGGGGVQGGPGAGIGVRYLDDKMQGAGAYEREITYFYFPIGLRGELALGSKGWKLGAGVEYDLFLAGNVKSHLSETSPDRPDITNSQTSGFGARASLEMAGVVGKVSIRIQPYYQLWQVDDSNTAYINKDMGYAHEPSNKTQQYGFSLVLGI
jgi:hypothetical protein